MADNHHSRLKVSRWISTVCAVIVFASLFLNWYCVSDKCFSGWQTFSITDIVLTLGAVLAVIWSLIARLYEGPAVEVAVNVAVVWVSLIGSVGVIYRLLTLDSGTLQPGAFIGLVAVLIMTGDAWRAMASEDGQNGDQSKNWETLTPPPA